MYRNYDDPRITFTEQTGYMTYDEYTAEESIYPTGAMIEIEYMNGMKEQKEIELDGCFDSESDVVNYIIDNYETGDIYQVCPKEIYY